MDSGWFRIGNVALVCESQIKGLVEGMDLGLVSLHMKGVPWQRKPFAI